MDAFFEPPPPTEPPRRAPRYRTPAWVRPPQGTLPAVVPLERVLARTDDVAVCVARVAAYPTGFELRLLVLSDATLEKDLDPFGFRFHHEPAARRVDADDGIPRDLLRVGLQFADGSKATNLAPRPITRPEPSTPVMIETGGGGGGGGRWERGYWVWPLPPPGPLAIVCEWPAAGIPLTRHEIDAAVLLDAVPRAQVVFSDESLPEHPGR